jgi:hypothetical protein
MINKRRKNHNADSRESKEEEMNGKKMKKDRQHTRYRHNMILTIEK